MDGQAKVIRQAYQNAGLDPAQVCYVECHGTGTPVGDPIEAAALAQVFCQGRTSNNNLVIGSIKTNLGHTEACSGIAGMMKAVLALENAAIPPSLGFDRPNPKILFNEWCLKVATETTDWPESCAKIASVNSFGFGGANGHIILEAPSSSIPQKLDGRPNGKPNRPHTSPSNQSNGKHEDSLMSLLVFSAKNPLSLQANINAFIKNLSSGPHRDLHDIAYTLSCRSSLTQRAFCLLRPSALKSCNIAPAFSSDPPQKPPKLAFCFTGN